MTGLHCLFGIHSIDVVRVVEHRAGRMVVVGIARCARCGIRISEEVTAVGSELQEPEHG